MWCGIVLHAMLPRVPGVHVEYRDALKDWLVFVLEPPMATESSSQ